MVTPLVGCLGFVTSVSIRLPTILSLCDVYLSFCPSLTPLLETCQIVPWRTAHHVLKDPVALRIAAEPGAKACVEQGIAAIARELDKVFQAKPLAVIHQIDPQLLTELPAKNRGTDADTFGERGA